MPKVFWSDRAQEVLDSLPDYIREAVKTREAYLRRFPEMYAVVQEGRHRGKHRLTVLGRYHVYYRLHGPVHDCFVTDIEPARGRPR